MGSCLRAPGRREGGGGTGSEEEGLKVAAALKAALKADTTVSAKKREGHRSADEARIEGERTRGINKS